MGRTLKQPAWWITAIVMPVMMMGLLGAGFAGLFEAGIWLQPFEVILVNEDDHVMMQLTQDHLLHDEAIGRLVTITVAASEEEGLQLMTAREAAALVIIPQGMIQTLEAGENKALRMVLDPQQSFEGQLVTKILEHAMKSISGGQSAVYTVWHYYQRLGLPQHERTEKINQVMQEMTLRAFRIRGQLLAPEVLVDMKSFGTFAYYGTAVMVLFILFLAVTDSRQWLQERQSGINHSMSLGGMTPAEIMGLQMARLFSMATIQTSFLAAFLWYIQKDRGISLAGFIALYASLVVLVSSISLLMGVWIRQEDTFQTMLSGLLLSSGLLGGGLIPLHYLPDFVRPLSRLTPHYWMLTASLQLQAGDGKGVAEVVVGFLLVSGGLLGLAMLLEQKQQEVSM